MSILNIAEELNNMFNINEFDVDIDNHFVDNEVFETLNNELTNNDEVIYSCGGHYDEQTLDQYYSMTDEDGRYIHPLVEEEFI